MLRLARRLLVSAFVAAALALPGAACSLDRGSADDMCSIGEGEARCDGNVLVTCGKTCLDSSCDNIQLADVRTDCGEYAACSLDGSGSPSSATCRPTGQCAVDADCCAPRPTEPPACYGTVRCESGTCAPG